MGLLWNILRIVSASTALGWEWSSSIISDVEPRHLRGLSADTVGGVNLVDVSFVVICVVMAGFASGLTQVRLQLQSYLNVYFSDLFSLITLRDYYHWIRWRWKSKQEVVLLKKKYMLPS